MKPLNICPIKCHISPTKPINIGHWEVDMTAHNLSNRSGMAQCETIQDDQHDDHHNDNHEPCDLVNKHSVAMEKKNTLIGKSTMNVSWLT